MSRNEKARDEGNELNPWLKKRMIKRLTPPVRPRESAGLLCLPSRAYRYASGLSQRTGRLIGNVSTGSLAPFVRRTIIPLSGVFRSAGRRPLIASSAWRRLELVLAREHLRKGHNLSSVINPFTGGDRQSPVRIDGAGQLQTEEPRPGSGAIPVSGADRLSSQGGRREPPSQPIPKSLTGQVDVNKKGLGNLRLSTISGHRIEHKISEAKANGFVSPAERDTGSVSLGNLVENQTGIEINNIHQPTVPKTAFEPAGSDEDGASSNTKPFRSETPDKSTGSQPSIRPEKSWVNEDAAVSEKRAASVPDDSAGESSEGLSGQKTQAESRLKPDHEIHRHVGKAAVQMSVGHAGEPLPIKNISSGRVNRPLNVTEVPENRQVDRREQEQPAPSQGDSKEIREFTFHPLSEEIGPDREERSEIGLPTELTAPAKQPLPLALSLRRSLNLRSASPSKPEPGSGRLLGEEPAKEARRSLDSSPGKIAQPPAATVRRLSDSGRPGVERPVALSPHIEKRVEESAEQHDRQRTPGLAPPDVFEHEIIYYGEQPVSRPSHGADRAGQKPSHAGNDSYKRLPEITRPVLRPLSFRGMVNRSPGLTGRRFNPDTSSPLESAEKVVSPLEKEPALRVPSGCFSAREGLRGIFRPATRSLFQGSASAGNVGSHELLETPDLRAIAGGTPVRQQALDLIVAVPPPAKRAPIPLGEKVYRNAAGTSQEAVGQAQSSQASAVTEATAGPAAQSTVPSQAGASPASSSRTAMSGTGTSVDLNALARELYPFIRRMVMVERERLPF